MLGPISSKLRMVSLFLCFLFYFSKRRKEIGYIMLERAVLMAVLGVGDARTPRPQWNAYASGK